MESTKLSFSLSSKPSSKRPSTDFSLQPTTSKPDSTHHDPQFVTEFDSSKTLNPQNQSSTPIIPRLENTWNPYKKMKNIDLPMRGSASDDPDLRFEVEAPTTADATDSSMSYGLNVRGSAPVTESNTNSAEARPSTVENVILQRFKEDMKNLPDDLGMAEFDDVPVEGFGAALLKAYGWKEGDGIGKNCKEDVKVVQYVRRGEKEGLGFMPEVEKIGRKVGKSKSNQQPQLVAPKGADGKTRHVVGIDEKLVPRELKGIHVGKIVRIVSGRHVGLKGKVLEKFESKSTAVMVVLKLRNDEEVTVRLNEVAELGTVDDEMCLEELKLKEDTRKNERRDRENEKRNGGRDDKRRNGDVKDVKYGNGRDHRIKVEDKPMPVSWLTSHIKVRIISKEFKGGKLYLKKGSVVDVVGLNTCDIRLDESNQLIQGVNQNILETAVPKRGGPVLVLYGKHKGVFGNLVERNMEKETGVVQDADNHDLITVNLEQIAEYIGDPSFLGY